MMLPPGSRVIAISHGDEEAKILYIFGYGVFVGWEKTTCMGVELENPKILLDNGKVVWGYECWWGPPESSKRWPDFQVVCVDIDARRSEANRENEAT